MAMTKNALTLYTDESLTSEKYSLTFGSMPAVPNTNVLINTVNTITINYGGVSTAIPNGLMQLVGASNNIKLSDVTNNTGTTFLTPAFLSEISADGQPHTLGYLTKDVYLTITKTISGIQRSLSIYLNYKNNSGNFQTVLMYSRGRGVAFWETSSIYAIATNSDTTNSQHVWFVDDYTASAASADTRLNSNALNLKVFEALDIDTEIPAGGEPTSTGTGGGFGTRDNFTVSIGIPSLDIANTALGFGGLGSGPRVYVASAGAVSNLYKHMWTTSIWDKWNNKNFQPINGVISIHRVPAMPAHGGAAPVTLCGQTYNDVLMSPVTTGTVVTMGTFSCQLPEYSASFLDYSPYTKMTLFLPFCGSVKIDTNVCMGGGLTVTYRCDTVSGNVIVFIEYTDRFGNTSLYDTVTGNAICPIPLYADNGGGIISSILPTLTGGAMMIGGGMTGNIPAVIGGAGMAGSAAINAERKDVHHVGSISHSVAAMGNMTIFLQIEYPQDIINENDADIRGIPAEVGGTVGAAVWDGGGQQNSGYCQYSSVDLSGVDCTAEEAAEIERLLKEGVYL